MRVRWLRTALANLNAEAEYIARDNPAAALRVVFAVVVALLAVEMIYSGIAGRI